MKLLGLGILAFIFIVLSSTSPAGAVIESAPSNSYPVKINGPLLITGYSFSGHTINYVQIYNASPTVVSLENWQVAYEYNSTNHEAARLSGLLAPRQYVTIAREAILPNATFL